MKYLPTGQRNGAPDLEFRRPTVDPHVTYVEIDPTTEDHNGFAKWLHSWTILTRHKFALAITSVCGLIVGVVVSMFQTPLYRAGTTLEVQQAQQQPFQGIAFMNNGDASVIQTQVELLRSNHLLNRVDARLKDETPEGSHLAPTRIGSIRSWLGLSERLESEAWREGVNYAGATLQVTPLPNTRIVRIVSESSHPQAAADYVNTLAQEFIEYSQEERWSQYQSTGAWLERAQTDLKTRLEEAERRLGDYAASSGLVVLSQTQNIGERKLIDLQTELTSAQADRISKEAAYQTAVSRPEGSVVDLLNRGSLNTYEVQLADFRRQLAEATTSLTSEHPKVKRLEAQIQEIELSQERERRNILTRLRADYDAAVRREQQLSEDFTRQTAVLSEQDKKLIAYKMLQREVDTYRSLYETTLQRGREASLASAMRLAIARVVDHAGVPGAPFKPNIPLNLLFGAVGGLLVGVGVIFARERTDTSVRLPGSVLASANVRELGIIPAARIDSASSYRVTGAPRTLLPAGRTTVLPDARVPESIELATWNHNTSMLADSFRATLTSILLSGDKPPDLRVILVTSPSPREGKSTVTTNLAIALAEINQRVLVIDADFRRPRLHTIFGQSNTWGLGDLLQDTTPCAEYPIEALARETFIPRVHTIPNGVGGVAVSRLIHSPRMEELLARLRNDFDSILIDTPPVLHVPDARVLARFADAVLLVVRARHTRQAAVETAVHMLAADGIPLLGTVLNDWNPRDAGHGYHSADYSQSYYERDAAGE